MLKMVVMRQGIKDTVLLHDNKIRTVCMPPLLINPLAIKVKSGLKGGFRIGNGVNIRISHEFLNQAYR